MLPCTRKEKTGTAINKSMVKTHTHAMIFVKNNAQSLILILNMPILNHRNCNIKCSLWRKVLKMSDDQCRFLSGMMEWLTLWAHEDINISIRIE